MNERRSGVEPVRQAVAASEPHHEHQVTEYEAHRRTRQLNQVPRRTHQVGEAAACPFNGDGARAQHEDARRCPGYDTSVEHLTTCVLAFITYYNRALAKPLKWTYQGKLLTA
jgi:hypothetical protein